MGDEQLTSAQIPRSTGMSLLPGELLSKILTFVVASDTPVEFSLFPNFNFDYDSREYYTKEAQSGCLSLPTKQREHHQDWICMSMTSHRFRQYGLPAFFREKTFIVPADMLRTPCTRDKERFKSLLIAKESIRHIIVICLISESYDYLCLKNCHDFTSLASMTIWAPKYCARLLVESDRIKFWPIDMPEEFRDLLMKTGLRMNDIEIKLVICAKSEEWFKRIMDHIRDITYTRLRASIAWTERQLDEGGSTSK